MFDGTLGTWNTDPVDIELKDDAKPHHARPYPVPKVHKEVFKKEVTRLCKLGVLRKVNRSEWGDPTFIKPKKNGTVRFLSDFRELNKRIRRKPFPIPKIQDMLLKLEGFTYASSLDLNMGYYHIQLTPHARDSTILYSHGGCMNTADYLWGYVTLKTFSKRKSWNCFKVLIESEHTLMMYY